MSRQQLHYFSHPQLLQEMSAAGLRKLLQPFQQSLQQLGLEFSAESIDVSQLTQLLSMSPDGIPEELLQTIYRLDALATPQGMDELLRMIPELNPPWNEWTPVDVALQAWQFDAERFELTFANHQIGRRSRRFTSYNAVHAWRTETITATQIQRMEQAFTQQFAQQGRGEGVRLLVSKRSEEIWILVRYGELLRREACLSNGESSSILFRPERYDAIVLLPNRGEIRINATTRWQRDLYRQICGAQLCGKADFFPGEDRYTLKPLLTAGSRCLLTHDLPGIDAIKLTEIEYFDRAPGQLGTKKWGDDLFAMLGEDLSALPGEARLFKAKFLIRFRGTLGWRTVSITTPNEVKYAIESDAVHVEDWLEKRGFLMTGGSDDAATTEADSILAFS